MKYFDCDEKKWEMDSFKMESEDDEKCGEWRGGDSNSGAPLIPRVSRRSRNHLKYDKSRLMTRQSRNDLGSTTRDIAGH